jgi:hypothetical protein
VDWIFVLNFIRRGLSLSLCLQHGHHSPGQFTKTSQIWHRF